MNSLMRWSLAALCRGEDIQIMREEDIDAVHPQPLQAELDRAQHAIMTVVIALLAVRRVEELAEPVR